MDAFAKVPREQFLGPGPRLYKPPWRRNYCNPPQRTAAEPPPEGLAPRIANLVEWRAHLLDRLRRQVAITNDPVLTELLQEPDAYPLAGKLAAMSATAPGDYGNVLVPLEFVGETGLLSLISTTMMFGTPRDVTLSELALEAFSQGTSRRQNAAPACRRRITIRQSHSIVPGRSDQPMPKRTGNCTASGWSRHSFSLLARGTDVRRRTVPWKSARHRARRRADAPSQSKNCAREARIIKPKS